MNRVLADLIDEVCPKINLKDTRGSIKEEFSKLPDYLDNIIRDSMQSLLPSVDLVYEGYRRLLPEEEFRKMYSSDRNKVKYDIAPTDTYAIELVFRYRGKLMPRILYLPFADVGNIMRVSNTQYIVTPVLSDTVISPSQNKVFVRALKDKLNFDSVSRTYVVNGEKVAGQTIHSTILKAQTKQDNIGKPLPVVSLYILGQMGLSKAMEKYIGTDKWFVTTSNVDHQRDRYNVYESSKIKPNGLKQNVYRGHDLKICVDKSVPQTHLLNNLLFGMLYVFDILPDSANDYIKAIGKTKDELLFWRIALGRIVYKNSYSVERMTTDVVNLFVNLRGYMDNLTRNKLKDIGIYITDFFDLLAVILENYSTWLINSKGFNSDIENRYVDTSYYIMYDIIEGVNKVINSINKRASKKEIGEKELQKLFTNHLSTRKIYSLVKSREMSLALQMADYSGDNAYYKCTSLLEDQSRGIGVKKSKEKKFPTFTKEIHGDDLLFGSLLFLKKGAPSPRFSKNIYVHIDEETGRFKVDEETAKVLRILDHLFKGRIENAQIDELV